MGMIFTDASERSRAEPTPIERRATDRKTYAEIFDEGERHGWRHGWRYGVVCGVVLCSCIISVAAIVAGVL